MQLGRVESACICDLGHRFLIQLKRREPEEKLGGNFCEASGKKICVFASEVIEGMGGEEGEAVAPGRRTAVLRSHNKRVAAGRHKFMKLTVASDKMRKDGSA